MIEQATTGKDKPRSYNGDYMEIGKEGEKIVIEWLKSRPNVLNLTDYREIREIHEADIDVGVKLYTGQICLAEIKTDTHLGISGNILNEVLRINHNSKPRYAGYLGWTLRSPAEFLLYYAPNRIIPAIYKGRFAEMRNVLQKYTQENKVQFQVTRTNKTKTTYNLLIPEKEYLNVFTVYEL